MLAEQELVHLFLTEQNVTSLSSRRLWLGSSSATGEGNTSNNLCFLILPTEGASTL